MKLTIPELSLIVLIGPSGSGKSTFARAHFKPTEVLSSDFCRGLVSDDENDQAATNAAFEVLHFIATKRLVAGKITVIDATNVQPEARRPLVSLAREYHCLPVAIVFDIQERLCQERNRNRPDRNFGPHVVRRQHLQLRKSLRTLRREGFRYVFVLSSPEEVEAAVLERQPLWTNRKSDIGPFDIIGDVHGCFDELLALLRELGYQLTVSPADGPNPSVYTLSHPAGRRPIFLGDLVDRGPKILAVLQLVIHLVESGMALWVPGNHDVKLMRHLKGRAVRVTHGLADSLTQLERESPEFKARVATFIDNLISHYVLDGGKLVVAHAGMKEAMQGRASAQVRDFALFGETAGETDEFGVPIRYNWAAEYRGDATVVYGHTPVRVPEWLNNTINIDTGCVFGGRLTALRYPERELVSVPALRAYYTSTILPSSPAAPGTGLTLQQQVDELLDINDVVGKRRITTSLGQVVTIGEERAMTALEVMSRFAVNPKWLIYLPPTMSPSETTRVPELLEHPAEAFAYYAHRGVSPVICEEKHMGSRAIAIVCRDEETARKRFGITDEDFGICYTRTGRRFFTDAVVERELLAAMRSSLDAAALWDRLRTKWVCLDCEIMPWSAKAQDLLRLQYAAVGAAARQALAEAVSSMKQAVTRSPDVGVLLQKTQSRAEMAARYVGAYRQYCWPVRSVADLKVAPFHLLATEGAVHVDKDHLWHLETLAALGRAEGTTGTLFHATAHKIIDVTDPASREEGTRWWTELTERGGEGMVVKPLNWVVKGRKGLAQPALKCRGREYLRIIYGPEYTAPENLVRLRARSLSAKRSLALREFALGIEALERFARGEPLRRVHECVFGILALESEPVDPRL